ncbi:hypothetical protein C8R43DRAFT_945172 [Mycena crocata]|nr:hypothetical protein C8R43DRAFT_945172 [Mycena crocata]
MFVQLSIAQERAPRSQKDITSLDKADSAGQCSFKERLTGGVDGELPPSRIRVRPYKYGGVRGPFLPRTGRMRWVVTILLYLDFFYILMTVGSCEVAPRTLTVEFFNNPYRPVPYRCFSRAIRYGGNPYCTPVLLDLPPFLQDMPALRSSSGAKSKDGK